jgi:hypothetical protein
MVNATIVYFLVLRTQFVHLRVKKIQYTHFRANYRGALTATMPTSLDICECWFRKLYRRVWIEPESVARPCTEWRSVSFSDTLISDVMPHDRLCDLVSEFLAIDPKVPVLIPGASRFYEKQRVWNGVHSASWGQLRSYLKGKVAAPV